MRSISETGHAKNVANFDKILGFVRDLGTLYQPSNAALSIAALETLQGRAKASMAALVQARLKNDDAVIERTACFGNLTKLSTRVVSALLASGVPAGKVEDARALLRKIAGRRASATKPVPTSALAEGEKPTKTVSVSQQSYDSRADFFGKLVALVTAEPAYQPNEAQLKQETLLAKETELRTCNTKTTQSGQQVKLAMQERDRVLYFDSACLADCASLIKTYLKATSESNGNGYKLISGLVFSRPS